MVCCCQTAVVWFVVGFVTDFGWWWYIIFWVVWIYSCHLYLITRSQLLTPTTIVREDGKANCILGTEWARNIALLLDDGKHLEWHKNNLIHEGKFCHSLVPVHFVSFIWDLDHVTTRLWKTVQFFGGFPAFPFIYLFGVWERRNLDTRRKWDYPECVSDSLCCLKFWAL